MITQAELYRLRLLVLTRNSINNILMSMSGLTEDIYAVKASMSQAVAETERQIVKLMPEMKLGTHDQDTTCLGLWTSELSSNKPNKIVMIKAYRDYWKNREIDFGIAECKLYADQCVKERKTE